uniref:lysosomal-associated transmembrane protein 4B n=1 Tax=Halichoerus grypus TaxID=9711 RepID=UPI001659FE4C|nr:lysosomal-associated transmembrane protein 4B [Halichoerus grypus]
MGDVREGDFRSGKLSLKYPRDVYSAGPYLGVLKFFSFLLQIINAVVLLILLSALADPDQYHFSSSELGGDFEFMDDANMCIAIAISLLMILICAMATYGAYKQRAAWIIPFFCYQIFDFALNTLVAVTVLVYPNSIQEYIRQLPPNFPYRDDIMSVNPTCLVLIILLFISIILTFKERETVPRFHRPTKGYSKIHLEGNTLTLYIG